MNGLEPTRLIRIGLELAAQAGDVIVHRAGRRESGVIPDDVEKAFAGNGLAGGFGHESQHGKFFGGQMEGFLAFGGGLLDEIDASIAKAESSGRIRFALHAAEQCADASEQFVGAERFDEIIVGAGIEAGDTVFDLAFGGEHEDGNGIGEAAQLGAKGKTIELWHHDIQQNEIGFFREGATQAGFAVWSSKNAIVFADEHVVESSAHGEFVFDD